MEKVEFLIFPDTSKQVLMTVKSVKQQVKLNDLPQKGDI